MESPSPKKTKCGRPENPKNKKTIRIAAPLEALANPVMKTPPKPDTEWRYVKDRSPSPGGQSIDGRIPVS